METTTLTPKDFATIFPLRSRFGKAEAEMVALNIMVILARTGNIWRKLEWNEYTRERVKDGALTDSDQYYFEKVVEHTQSPIMAERFSAEWRF